MKQQNETIRPRALLAGVHLNQNNDFEVSMKELHNLVKACDMDPVASSGLCRSLRRADCLWTEGNDTGLKGTGNHSGSVKGRERRRKRKRN